MEKLTITNEEEKKQVLKEISDAKEKLELLDMETQSYDDEVVGLTKKLSLAKEQLAKKKAETSGARKSLEALIKPRRDAIADYEISKA